MYQVYFKAQRQGCDIFKEGQDKMKKRLKFTKYTKNTWDICTIFEKDTLMCMTTAYIIKVN